MANSEDDSFSCVDLNLFLKLTQYLRNKSGVADDRFIDIYKVLSSKGYKNISIDMIVSMTFAANILLFIGLHRPLAHITVDEWVEETFKTLYNSKITFESTDYCKIISTEIDATEKAYNNSKKMLKDKMLSKFIETEPLKYVNDGIFKNAINVIVKSVKPDPVALFASICPDYRRDPNIILRIINNYHKMTRDVFTLTQTAVNIHIFIFEMMDKLDKLMYSSDKKPLK